MSTKDSTQYLQALRQFAHDVVAPLAAKPAHEQHWAGDAIRKACQQDLGGIEVPREQGGLGLPFQSRIEAVQTLAEVDLGFAFGFVLSANVRKERRMMPMPCSPAR